MTSAPALRATAESIREHYVHRDTCRACGSPQLEVFLDLGETPPANRFLTREQLGEPEFFFPLQAVHCLDCHLVQLPDAVDPALLFQSYLYLSSSSGPVVEHFRKVATDLAERYLQPNDLVCEIGSNDGVFLQHLVGRARVLGIDPAANIARFAEEKGVTTLTAFFNLETARRVRREHGAARLVFAANVLAHIDDLEGAFAGAAELLDDEGVLVFEVHRFADMLRERHFDQIYHEHLCYWALHPVEVMLGRFGLRLIDVKLVPMQGESYQFHAARTSSSHAVSGSVAAMRAEEEQLGLTRPETYRAFGASVERTIEQLRSLIEGLRADGKRVAGYGAPAKATTLLSAAGLGAEHIAFITDTTPAKQGRFMPGTHIPILEPSVLLESPPDYLLLFAWNYADDILRREQALRDRGTRFIIPFPEPRVV